MIGKKNSVTWQDEQCLQVQIAQKSKETCENSYCEQSIQVLKDQHKVEDSNCQINQNNLIYDQIITTTYNNESFQDLRIGDLHRQKWAEVQIDQKILKSSPNITQNEINNQDIRFIKDDGEQKEDEKLQEEDLQELQSQTLDQDFQVKDYINESQDVNNSNQIVDRFLKGQQIQQRSNSRKGTRRLQSGECQSIDQSKMIETQDLNNKSFSNTSRHRGSCRFKADDPMFVESGFKKKKPFKTCGGTKVDSQDSETNEEGINNKSQKKIHRTSQEVYLQKQTKVNLFQTSRATEKLMECDQRFSFTLNKRRKKQISNK